MGRQVLFGASDDLIELRGDVDEEFSSPEGDRGWVATSSGVLVSFRLQDVWEWRLVKSAPDGVTVEVVPARGEDEGDDADGCPGYSDKVVITTAHGEAPAVVWVAMATAYAT